MSNSSVPSSAPDVIAAALLAAHDEGRQVAPISAQPSPFGLAEAYRVTPAIRRLREARGEVVIGRKIGFTNRTIWAEYGVYAPIWGYVYDTTFETLVQSGGTCDLAGLLEPRIEPEIAFGLKRAPEPDMDEAALIGCIDWVAHSVEVVQSLYPGWRFEAADTVAAFGLHGALRLGDKHAVTAANAGEWLAALPRFTLALARDGVEMDRGTGANVLDGPLSALRHLVGLLDKDSLNPPLAAGEIVSTGTLTRAFPVAPGETWSTRPHGLPLEGFEIAFR